MSSDFRKFARLVSAKRPCSSFLSEKAMAWIRKSTRPQSSARVWQTRSSDASSCTSACIRCFEPTLSASGFTRRPKFSPW